MPTPTVAPPIVIDFSCGTTQGITPCVSVASTRSAYVVIASHSTMPAARSTAMTWLKPARSIRGRNRDARVRKRLEVFLARPIASLPRSRSSARSRASFSPWITAGALIRIPVQVIARPRRVVRARAIEQYLEELQSARSERRDRTAQIKPPRAHERLVVHVRDAVAMRLETIEPVLDRQRIMRPQIFHVENTAAQRLEDFDHLAHRGRVSARENTFFDPRVQRHRLVLADAVYQPAARLGQAAVDDAREIAIMFAAHVLEHA